MGKSKFVKANEKIAEKVVDIYKKIEDTFVERYLIKDCETVEEAKERLKREQKHN